MNTLLASGYVVEWLDFLFRWFHVVVGVTWIGTSIYFVRLDNSLGRPAGERVDDPGAGSTVGEHWGVHGGGFYHVQKYSRPPEPLPELHFATPWPAYSTWLTGFAMMVIVYYSDARTYLIDRSVADIGPSAAVALSIGLLAGGWLAYDLVCRLLGGSEWLVAAAVVALTFAAAYVATSLFSPRAAFLQVGAMLGTFMAANVLTVIIPMHRKMVAARRAGREPDAADGARAKQRSVHNTYLTLPVLLAMLSNHAPFIYSHTHAWLALLALMALGALIRHGFVMYQLGGAPKLVPAVAIVALVALVVSLAPADAGDDADPAPAAAGATEAERPVGAQVFQTAGCVGCHTLAAAGASADVGPDLDRLQPSADLVSQTVANGLGAMPPFKARLSDEQIRSVADYVALVAGRP